MMTLTLVLSLLGCSEYAVHGQPNDGEAPITSTTATDAFIPVAVVSQGLTTKREVAILLDGSESYDPDDDQAILTVMWAVIDAPTKEYTFTETDTLTPSFTTNTLGLYTFKLTVTDTDGNVSENLAMTAVEVVQWEDLEVEISWIKEVDVDLHLLAPGGVYYEASDCYYGNPEPDWGIVGNLNDNPVLVDDGEGASLERITLHKPEVGSYSIYAHYFNDYGIQGLTNVQVSMTVRAEGEIIAEYANIPLLNEDMVQLFGELDWDTLTWTERLANFTHEELGGPETNRRR